MNKKFNPILLGCAVAFAVMVAAPIASASAETGRWYVGGAKFSGEESLSIASSGPVTLTTTVGGTELVIQCEAKGAAAKISGNNLNSWKLALSACKTTKPAGCVTKATLETTTMNGSLGAIEAGYLNDKMNDPEAEKLLTVPVSECAAEGSYKVTGDPQCAVASPGTESAVKQCSFDGVAGLKFGLNAATLSGTLNLELAGADKGKVWTAKGAGPAPTEWYVNNSKFAGEETLKIASTTPFTLKTSGVPEAEKITCSSMAANSPKISGGSKDSWSSMTLAGCSDAGCMIPSTLTTVALSGGLEGAEGDEFNRVGEAEGGLFTFSTWGCSMEMSLPVTGAPRCEILQPEIESAIKECEYTPTSSKLKLDGHASTLIGTVSMELTGADKGDSWTG